MNATDLKFETQALHGNESDQSPHNAIRYPVYSGVAFAFDNAEDMELAFTHRKPSHAYTRITNPTVANFEKKLNLLEGGLGCIAFSSGMAALTTTLLSIMQAGENLVASKHLFGNTYSLLKETLTPLGIETRFVDIRDEQAVESAIDGDTRLILLETISNPQMVVPDFSTISAIAKAHNLILAVDGTVTTPYLFTAGNHGVDLVIHSTTKFISGGATSVGGGLIDLGTFDWKKCPALNKYHRFGQGALLARLRLEVHRNFGSCMAPQSAFLQTLGLETLGLRVKTSCTNCQSVADYLEQKEEVSRVNYPGLTTSPYHNLAQKQFNGHYGGVLSFELQDKEVAYKFANALQLIRRATNINDNKSLIIHPASTIFAECSEPERLEMEVSPGLLRLSLGIEDLEDLVADLQRGFAAIHADYPVTELTLQ